MGYRPVDRGHLSRTGKERSQNTTDYRDSRGGKAEQAKSSFREDIIISDLVLTLEVRFQYTDTHS